MSDIEEGCCPLCGVYAHLQHNPNDYCDDCFAEIEEHADPDDFDEDFEEDYE